MTARDDNADILRSTTVRLCCAISIGVSVGYYLLLFYRQPATYFDDAHMFIRYAKNFLAGFGHAWNRDGVQTYGSTSLLHFLVVTLLRGTLPYQDAAVLKLASYLMGLPAIAVLAGICSHFSRSRVLHRRPLLWCALLCPLLIFSDVFLYHSRTGMDTMLAFLCNSLLILAALHWVRASRAIALIPVLLMAYLCFLARPDSGVYALFFPTLLALCTLPREKRNRRAGAFVAGLGVLLLADAAVKHLIFGNPLPLPFYAKSAGFYEGYAGAKHWNPVAYLILFVGAGLPFLFPTAVWAGRAHARTLIPFLVPPVLTIGYFFTATQIMGFHARFLYPAMPFLIVSGALVLDSQFNDEGEPTLRFSRAAIARLLGLILIIGLLPVLARTLPPVYERAFLSQAPEHPIHVRFATADPRPLPGVERQTALTVLAEAARQFPEGTVISLSEYGFIGAQAPHVTIVDPLGLHDRLYALQGFSADDFFEREPDFIWMPHHDYTYIVAAILNAPRFAAEYDYYPGAFSYGAAIRRDSAHRQVIEQAFGIAWTSTYKDRYDRDLYRATVVRQQESINP